MAESQGGVASGTTGKVIVFVGRVVFILLIAVGVLATGDAVTIYSLSLVALMAVCGVLSARLGIVKTVLLALATAGGLLLVFPIGVGLLLAITILAAYEKS